MLTKAWNASIKLVGGVAGRVLRMLIRRQWLYFPFVSQWIATIPFSFGYKLRNAIYKRLLPSFGSEVIIHWGAIFEDERSTLGSDIWIGPGCYLDYVEIGDHVLIGPGAVLLSGGRRHRFERTDIPMKSQGNLPKTALRVGNDVWIGANATVMANLGDGCIVGAGAVVTHEVPPMAVVAGNPAKILYHRSERTRTEAL